MSPGDSRPQASEPWDDSTDPDAAEVTSPGEGSLIAGRYRLGGVIAQGGMSVVHLATHVELERKVAFKVLHPPPALSDAWDFTERFRAEAKTLASFSHRNVVVLHDFGKLPAGGYFLAMEYVEGPTLSALLKSGELTLDRTLHLLTQLAEALRYTHQRGVVHKDVKPSNVLVARDVDGREVVKLVDFGIAEPAQGADDTHEIVLGSPSCMSPEQILGQPSGPASDIYGFGCVAFRALGGRYPYHGTRQEILESHLRDPVPSMRPAADLPEALDRVVQRCLAKAPEDRFEDMAEVITALALAAPEIPDLLHDPTSPTMARLRRSAQRAAEEADARNTTGAIPPQGTVGMWRGLALGGLVVVVALVAFLLRDLFLPPADAEARPADPPAATVAPAAPEAPAGAPVDAAEEPPPEPATPEEPAEPATPEEPAEPPTPEAAEAEAPAAEEAPPERPAPARPRPTRRPRPEPAPRETPERPAPAAAAEEAPPEGYLDMPDF